MGASVTDPVATPAGREHPFAAVLEALRHKGLAVKSERPGRARARCPVHHDVRPSLVVTEKPDKVLLRCFAGCKTSDVVARLGLRMADLFVPGGVRVPPRAVAVYDYCDLHGELIAQKLRFEPKQFRWRRPHPSSPGRHLWSLEGVSPGLYRLPDLIDVGQVYCLEGEKAVDLFWGLGLQATCPPSGASSWKEKWSADLQRVGCSELVVVPDADRPGVAHAERVAAACWNLPCPLPVKVVTLPGLAGGADAFDWLRDGHSAADLLELASSAPYWEPGAKERARADRKRDLTCERVRKHRRLAKERRAAEQLRPVTLKRGNAA